MPQFNLNAYYLKPRFDMLALAEAPPEQALRALDNGVPFPQRPTQDSPINRALAGTRVSATTIRGGKFAPYATTGML